MLAIFVIAVCAAGRRDPCSGVPCAKGTVCVVKHGLAACEVSTKTAKIGTDPCSRTRCPNGARCFVDGKGVPQCAGVKEAKPCDKVKCSAGLQCMVDTLGAPHCVNAAEGQGPCSGVVCDAGMWCISGKCVEDDGNSCSRVACPVGMTCSVDGKNRAMCTAHGCDRCSEGETCVLKPWGAVCEPREWDLAVIVGAAIAGAAAACLISRLRSQTPTGYESLKANDGIIPL